MWAILGEEPREAADEAPLTGARRDHPEVIRITMRGLKPPGCSRISRRLRSRTDTEVILEQVGFELGGADAKGHSMGNFTSFCSPKKENKKRMEGGGNGFTHL